MTEARIGRLLPACLHQAIFDVIPDRLEYYEEWLDPEGLRDGRIGLAPITAVVGFLRTEGSAYDGVMTRAGQLAAEWTLASAPSLQRRLIRRLPRTLRMRAALNVARRIVSDVLTTSAASASVRRGRARLDVTSSLFCSVRERPAAPLCAFYRAVALEALRAYDVPAAASIEQCRALGAASCRISIHGTTESAAPQAAAA
jgi:bacteriochlorophyll 4-vinyl reductase